VPSILADIYWARSLLSEILMILFTQSTAVLHKYLNDELIIPCLLQFFPEVAQNSPEFSTFREIPEYSRFVATVFSSFRQGCICGKEVISLAGNG